MNRCCWCDWEDFGDESFLMSGPPNPLRVLCRRCLTGIVRHAGELKFTEPTPERVLDLERELKRARQALSGIEATAEALMARIDKVLLDT